jgi:hypothetical protein
VFEDEGHSGVNGPRGDSPEDQLLVHQGMFAEYEKAQILRALPAWQGPPPRQDRVDQRARRRPLRLPPNLRARETNLRNQIL